MNKLFYCIWLLVLMCSCKDSLSPLEYVQYCQNPKNKLLKETIIGPIKYTGMLQTSDYTIVKQMGLNEIGKTIYDSLRATRENYLQVSLRIESSEIKGRPFFKMIATSNEDYIKLNRYFDNAQRDFYFKIGNERYYPNTYFFTPNQGFGNFEEIVFGTNEIPLAKLTEKDTIRVIYDDQIFKHGPLTFSFYPKDILSIPQLKL